MEIAVAIIGSLAGSVLPELLRHANTKLKKPLPVVKEVEALNMKLGYIESNIQDYYKLDVRSPNAAHKKHIENLRNLAYEIEDFIERFLRQVMYDGKEKEDISEKFVEQIASLKEKADSIKEGFQYGKDTRIVDGASSSTAGSRSPTRAPTSCAPTKAWYEQAVGIDKPLNELKKLVAESSVKKLKVISILGFGGLGKTLLADQVFDYSDDKTRFVLRVRIRADDKEPVQLLKEMLQEIRKKSPSKAGEDVNGRSTSDFNNASIPSNSIGWKRGRTSQLLQRNPQRAASHAAPQAGEKNKNVQNALVAEIKSLLDKKRYLIIIIDMRNVNQWCGIQNAFPQTEGKDSRIVVTTTKQPVAKSCTVSDGRVYKMSKLSRGDSCELLFPSENKPQNSSAILDPCDGLPLALLSTKHYLQGKDFDLQNYKDALNNIWRPEDAHNINGQVGDPAGRMRQVLLSIYEGLADHTVRACLLYFCMFPRDHVVRSNSLMRRLLAEGLGDGEAVVKNLKTLIDHGIIESAKTSYNGRAKGYKIPGILLEYITHISKSRDFVTVLDKDQGNARWLSVHPESNWNLPEKLPNVRTLAVFSNKDGQATALKNKQAIAGYILLRVLDMEGSHGLDNEDLKRICNNLVLLKYLSLGGSISKVPDEIKKLQLLETLDLRKTKIDMVPVQVIKLPRLKHLLGKFQLVEKGHFSEGKQTTRKKLGEFLSSENSKLEVLSGFVIGSREGFPQLLSHMTKLRKVKIWCNSTATKKNIADLSQGIQEYLCPPKANDRSLCIHISTGSPEPDDFLTVETASAGTTKETKHHPSLYSFKFKLYGELKRFPAFLEHLSSVTELCLSGTKLKAETMQGGLNSLRQSVLKYLKLDEENLGPMVLNGKIFLNLERICLVAKTKLEMIEIQDEVKQNKEPIPDIVLPVLTRLLSFHVLCKDLKSLTGIDKLLCLKEVGIHSGIEDEEKLQWNPAPMGHPNFPNVVRIDPVKS